MGSRAIGVILSGTASDGVMGMKAGITAAMKTTPDKVRVLTGNVGGSFGMKSQVYPEYAPLLLAAKLLLKAGALVPPSTARFDLVVAATGGEEAAVGMALAHALSMISGLTAVLRHQPGRKQDQQRPAHLEETAQVKAQGGGEDGVAEQYGGAKPKDRACQRLNPDGQFREIVVLMIIRPGADKASVVEG